MARTRHAAGDLNSGGRIVPLTQEDREWERVTPRRITRLQWKQLERYATEIFRTMGMPLDSAATKGTARRFIRALFDATEGYEGDPKLVTAFPTECDGGPDCRISQIVQGPIAFHSAWRRLIAVAVASQSVESAIASACTHRASFRA